MRSSRMGKRMESKGKIRRRTAGQELGRLENEWVCQAKKKPFHCISFVDLVILMQGHMRSDAKIRGE